MGNTDENLAQFCLEQKEAMNEAEWFRYANEVGRGKLGLIALILASDPWYGHRDALIRIAAELGALQDHPALKKHLDDGFNLPRFTNMLRIKARHIKINQ